MTKKSKIPAAVLKEVNKTLDKWAVKYRAGLTKALKKKHVQLLSFEQRRFVFHLCSRIPYRLCGIAESQDRRIKSDQTIKTMLLSLDFVLDHPHQHFFRTKQQKLGHLFSGLKLIS